MVFSISSMEKGMILIQDKRRSCYMFYNRLSYGTWMLENSGVGTGGGGGGAGGWRPPLNFAMVLNYAHTHYNE